MKTSHKAILSLLICCIGWVDISNATTNISTSPQSETQVQTQTKDSQEDYFPRFNGLLEQNDYSGAQQYMRQVANNIGLYAPEQQADIWYNLTLSYVAQDDDSTEDSAKNNTHAFNIVKDFLNNGIALKNQARLETVNKLFKLAYSVALGAEEYQISLNYLTQWEATGKQLNKQQTFHLGLLYYQLEEFDKASSVLTSLVTEQQSKGEMPDKKVLNLLVGINFTQGNLEEALLYQELLANLQQTEKNQTLLIQLREYAENNATGIVPTI